MQRAASVKAALRTLNGPGVRLVEAECAASGGTLACKVYTLAQLQAAGRETAQSLARASESLQAEVVDLYRRVPAICKSIWGRQSEQLVEALRERHLLANKLIAQWEEAEHRLIAVANSLVSSANGQRVLAVGIPLAASQLLLAAEQPAYCYHAPLLRPQHPAAGLGLELSLGEVVAAAQRLYAALAEELAIAARGAFLFFLFLPMVTTVPALLLGEAHRARWLGLLRWTLERAGPAFIKWGQWAATRPDLFPQDICHALAALQTGAPTHEFVHTRAAVEAAFGRPLEQLFARFETEPVASGSIAQVHRAALSPEGARLAGTRTLGGLLPLVTKGRRLFDSGATVAVKVRHPGVGTLMERDFTLMRRCAGVVAVLPLVGNPQIKESLMQFGAPLREQLDLEMEAEHLRRFSNNFRSWHSVTFPHPADAPLVSQEVLVETFEEGEHISRYVGEPGGKYNKKLADLGMNCYLKMLLRDNFVHADLHPGNILVRLEVPAPGSLRARLGKALGWELRLPKLVLLDVGMIAKLSDEDQANLVGFFKHLTSMDGVGLADAIMSFTEEKPPRPLAFREAMGQLFAGLDPGYMREHTPEVINSIMDAIREHQVHLKGVVSTVVITTMVLEGWSTKLNPEIRIVEALKEILPSAWGERVGKTVDRVCSPGSLAIAAI